jgi:hypothetical protein
MGGLTINSDSQVMGAGGGQGPTLVHFSAQPEPFLTQKHTLHTPDTPQHPLNNP